jgi:hypothetical protein
MYRFPFVILHERKIYENHTFRKSLFALNPAIHLAKLTVTLTKDEEQSSLRFVDLQSKKGITVEM